jgi:hypothetical protein
MADSFCRAFNPQHLRIAGSFRGAPQIYSPRGTGAAKFTIYCGFYS